MGQNGDVMELDRLQDETDAAYHKRQISLLTSKINALTARVKATTASTTTAPSHWTTRISVERLLDLDTQKALIPRGENNYVGPCAAGSAPSWLKCDLPRRPSPALDVSTVDLALPLDRNPFYNEMGSELAQELRKLTNSYSHSFLLGCSGCGKSAACLALARDKYVIYIEVPGGDAQPSKLRGLRMSSMIWSTSSDFLKTDVDVRGALYAEVAARVVVLYHMLQDADAQLTPLRWLLFTMSPEGSRRIGHVLDSIVKGKLEVLPSNVDNLLQSVTELISPDAGWTDMSSQPVLVVDELQMLTERSIVDKKGENMSLMSAAMNSASMLSLSVVWSGTRLHVMGALSKTSAFAKTLPNMRKLNVVGSFQFLEVDDVRRLLHRVLPLESLASSTVSHLCYALQGRARTCAGFISHLLTPGSAAMQPGAVLTDDIVLKVYEDFLNKAISSRVCADLASYKGLPQSSLSTDELGYLFCRTLLPDLHLPSGPCNREDCVAFTESVREVLVPVKQVPVKAPGSPLTPHSPSCPPLVRYAFKHRYGEPSLQEALLRYVREDSSIGDRGICRMLSGALTPSALGQYLNYAVALSLLCKGSLLLSALVAGTGFEKFSNYELSLDRIVSTSKTEDQLEWFRRVLVDPDDCTFPLLPGVPVKHIIVLSNVASGADAICVALSGDQQLAEHSVAGKGSPVKQKPDMVFIHVCCATYEGGAPGAQFSQVEPGKNATAAQYQEMAPARAKKYEIIPIVLEIPGNKSRNPTEVKTW